MLLAGLVNIVFIFFFFFGLMVMILKVFQLLRHLKGNFKFLCIFLYFDIRKWCPSLLVKLFHYPIMRHPENPMD